MLYCSYSIRDWGRSPRVFSLQGKEITHATSLKLIFRTRRRRRCREEEKSLARRAHRPAERPGTCAANHSPTRGSIDGNAPEDPLDYSRRWRTPAVASLPRRAVAVLVQLCSGGDGKHSPRPGVAGLPGSHEVGRAFLTDTWRKNIGLLAACQLRSTSGVRCSCAMPARSDHDPKSRRGST